MRRTLAIATLIAFSAACSHTVTIDSDPPGAEIKVNGEKLGSAPIQYTEQTGWERIYDIEASKGGFKTTRKQVRQTEWNMPVTAGSVIGGLLCLVPFAGLLFARQMPDRIVVSMERGGGGEGGETPPSSYGY